MGYKIQNYFLRWLSDLFLIHDWFCWSDLYFSAQKKIWMILCSYRAPSHINLIIYINSSHIQNSIPRPSAILVSQSERSGITLKNYELLYTWAIKSQHQCIACIRKNKKQLFRNTLQNEIAQISFIKTIALLINQVIIRRPDFAGI